MRRGLGQEGGEAPDLNGALRVGGGEQLGARRVEGDVGAGRLVGGYLELDLKFIDTVLI